MRKAFTLIELLIVVAIIAILAAIAVPNFIEAQTRAKTSRAKSDMRSLNTGLESYHVDNNSYPPCHTFGVPGLPESQAGMGNPVILERLSTPISYITTAIYPNPFQAATRLSAATAAGIPTATESPNPQEPVYRSFLYQAGGNDDRVAVMGSSVVNPPPSEAATNWVLHSPGPTLQYYNLGGVLFNSSGAGNTGSQLPDCLNLIYDPTNGTTSFGAIWRAGGATNSNYGRQMYAAINTANK